MPQSYRHISPEIALKIRLVITDIDGTLTSGGYPISEVVSQSVRYLEDQGIMVGLASGRTLPGLEDVARDLSISGPIIAENGGVAKLNINTDPVDLGYSREPALRCLKKLKTLFPDAIQEREDNQYRLVDVVFWSHGIETEQLKKHLDDTELLDSGYILHLQPKGISKGKTLIRILDEIGDGSLSPEAVMVFGDSLTDISLFQLFSHSVLIPNSSLPCQHRQLVENVARYTGDLNSGDGFTEVAFHIVNTRLNCNQETGNKAM